MSIIEQPQSHYFCVLSAQLAPLTKTPKGAPMSQSNGR